MQKKTRIKLSHSQVIGGGYLALIVVGALLLMLPFASRGGAAGPVLALFTSASAVCLTGITLVDTWTQWSPLGQLVILLLIQIGGLGFMTIATQILMLMRRKIGLRERAVLTESLSLNQLGGILNMTRMIVSVTLVVEAVGALLLSIYFVPRVGWARGLWFGLFHSVSAFCNAGFDLTGYFAPDSSLLLLAADPLPVVTIMLLTLIGGFGFIIWDDVLRYRGDFKKYHLHSKLALTMSSVLLAVGFFAYLVFEASASAAGMPLPQRLLTAAFTTASVRTTGFQVLPLSEMSSSGRLITIILMFIGGSPGSTAGGVKTTTIMVLLLYVKANLDRS
ncbi:MAG: Trk family potassium uptake protein, partial [Firmicutes bacterium]|nr:Trk family potassium uptake protein [Bacillota bacterium]